MSRRSTFAQDIISRQERMLRIAERDHDLTLAVLAAETDIPKETLASYKKDTAMPAWVLVALARVLPDHLTSLLFEPVGRFVGSCPAGDGTFDALARESAGYNVEYLAARAPDSEAGPALSPRERANLADCGRRLAAAAHCASKAA